MIHVKSKKIGKGTSIGPFCIIGEHVEIGQNCQIANNVVINGRTTIGNNNKIYPYAVLGNPPQDLKYKGEDTELHIGNDNIIREFCTINLGTLANQKTQIGNFNLFMNYVHIAHDCIIGDHCIFANVATLGGHVKIGDYVNLGGLSAVHQFVNIGDGCMIAGGSMVTQDIPPYCIAEGNRAVIKGLNRHRMRLLYEGDVIDKLSILYKELFSGTNSIKDIATAIMNNVEEKEHTLIKQICDFIIHSQRGIPYKKDGLNI